MDKTKEITLKEIRFMVTRGGGWGGTIACRWSMVKTLGISKCVLGM